MRLSIVIPAYNEEARLPRMLEPYLRFFESRHGDAVEFIVVVNGSTDRTAEVARGFAAGHPALRVLEEPRKIGKGGAVMLGFAAARGDLVGFVDADGATPPEAFQDLVDHIGNAGGIVASRWMAGSVVSPRQPLSRRIASRCFNGLVHLLFGLRLHDTQCGAKLLTAPAVQAILPHMGVTSWAFDVDLLFQLRRAGFLVVERPTVWHDVSGSQLKVGRASFEMLAAMIRLRLVYSPFRWVVDLYHAVTAPFARRRH